MVDFKESFRLAKFWRVKKAITYKKITFRLTKFWRVGKRLLLDWLNSVNTRWKFRFSGRRTRRRILLKSLAYWGT